jgi:DNA-binding response OmpR family regulator
MKILIADDDAVSRLLLNSALSKLGHDVRQVENGKDAMATWEKSQPSLIISDWMMPDLDGLELCRKVRARELAAFTYIILVTARTGKANYLEAMDAGVDDFITKPFANDELAARVHVAERILGLHENLRSANADLERRVRERTLELEEALNAKNQFLSRASHELRTPMNHVLGFAQLLQMDSLNAHQAGHVGRVLTSGRHLLRLIDQLLQVAESDSTDLSFLETGKTQMTSENSGMLTAVRAQSERSLG